MHPLVTALLLAPTAWSGNRALIVGSTHGGPGQAPLRWSGDDAARIEQVLVELGGFPADAIEVLDDPGVDDLLAAVGRAADAGDADQFVFYYSGHARSGSLSLGAEELAIDVLEAELARVHARQRLVVLDACQSGEGATSKGTVPAAEFSFVSVAGLSTSGAAVVASSSATELSQESDHLRASTFTHHWVTGLRGAADVDRDGAVTLDEAYGYAYDRTVVDSAASAIGAQHPTIRLDLQGQGAWILTRPAGAPGRLVLPVGVDGEITVVHRDSGTVAAEVAKVPGDSVALALPPGDYDVHVRRDGSTCKRPLKVVAGASAELDTRGCSGRLLAPATAKSDGAEAGDVYPLALVLGGGASFFQPWAWATTGLEVRVPLRGGVTMVGGVDGYATHWAAPTWVVRYADGPKQFGWMVLAPVHLGAVVAARTGTWRPSVGVEAIAVEYSYRNVAIGGRLRGGVDRMLGPYTGIALGASAGAWQGEDWDYLDRRVHNFGPVFQASVGLVLLPEAALRFP